MSKWSWIREGHRTAPPTIGQAAAPAAPDVPVEIIPGTVSVLVATLGRPTLERALTSITSQTKEGDQVLVIGATPEIEARAKAAGCDFVQCPPGNNWGGREREVGLQHATGEYVAFLDDDDIYFPDALDAMHAAMKTHPGQATIFKMHIAWTDGYLWTDPVLVMGNVGTPMVLLPNTPLVRRGRWGMDYGNDFGYLESIKLKQDDVNWDPFVVASIKPK